MPNEGKFPAQEMVLWAVELEHDVFRSGAAKKPIVEYLRFLDIGIDEIEGNISEEHLDKYVVKPGKNISMFLRECFLRA
jgi:hypothetical protein